MTIVDIAKICIEANKSYCEAIGEDHPAWNNLQEWQKNCAIKGVGFYLAYPDSSQNLNHDAHLAIQNNKGWTYSNIKDPILKISPDCVKYKDLPLQERIKDSLFKAIVEQLKGMLSENP